MSDINATPPCRREEVVLCKPDKTVPTEQKPQAPPSDAECAAISEKQFMRDHTFYSAISSWLFAISGATNIGLLSVLASKILSAVEKGQPIFTSDNPAVAPVFGNKKFNRIAMGMIGFGGVCMAVSNWLESKKVVTESQMLTNKMVKKGMFTENGQAQTAPAGRLPAGADASAAAQPKNWSASLQPKVPDPVDHFARQ